MLSVASSSHACRERFGGVCDCQKAGVRGGGPRVGGGPRAITD